MLQGDVTSLQWSGGTGTFSDPTGDQTNYTPGPGDIGDVVLQLCGEGNCADPVCTTITLPTGNASVVTITANGPLAICPGQDLVLSASGADSYVWSTQETTTSITITQPGNYSVVGTGACGSATASVVVASSPGPTVAISGDLAICAGGSTQLTATGADSYVWSTQATTASIVVTQPGTYSVVGTNACGTANASVNVTLLPGPVAGITGNTTICPGATTVLTATGGPSYLWSNGVTTASVTSGTAPLPVSFQSQSTPAGVDHAWTFGDGQGSGATSPSHTYMEPGVYQVVLTVSASGCLVTAQTTITVLGEPVEASELTVPNVFTPNGDGQNDQFGLIQVGITTVDMEIMNRWGQLVGRIERVGQEWDGRSPAGENVPDGTYFYVLKANGDDGKRYDLSGTITLLR
jgi:gliding motility-associated-like protein